MIGGVSFCVLEYEVYSLAMVAREPHCLSVNPLSTRSMGAPRSRRDIVGFRVIARGGIYICSNQSWLRGCRIVGRYSTPAKVFATLIFFLFLSQSDLPT